MIAQETAHCGLSRGSWLFV